VLRFLQRASGAAEVTDPLYRTVEERVVQRVVDKICLHCSDRQRDSLWTYFEKVHARDSTTALTEYEEPSMSGIIRDLVPAIDWAAVEMGYQLPSRKAVGTLPLPCLQATTINLCDTTAALIGVQTGLFDLCLEMTRVAITAIPIQTTTMGYEADFSPAAIRAETRKHPGLGSDYANAVLFYASHTAAFSREFESLDYAHGVYAGALLDGMETFVIAHEMAHVLLHHKSTSQIHLALSGSGGYEASALTTVDVDARSRQEETSADSLGLELLALSLRGQRGRSLEILGPDFFFGFLEGIGKTEKSLWGSSP
jgi:hypothetical protein